MANSTITGGSVVWNFDVNQQAFNQGLTQAQEKVNQLGNNIKKNEAGWKSWANNAADSLNGISASIAGLATKILAVTVGAGGLGAVFVNSAADMQKTAKQFDILIGNTEVAQDLFARLAKFAAETPFEMPQIANAAKTLLGFGISAQDVFGHIKTLGDLAAATGANYESLAVVFGQVNATGRLMGQDALQLINNNIPVTTILAKKLGVSVQEVKKRMEEGAISSQLFNDALTDVTKQGGFAFKGMEGLAQTFSGRMSTLKDTVMEFGRNLLGVKIDPELGLVIKPGGLFDQLTQMIPKIIAGLQEMTPKITAAFEFLVQNGGTIGAILAGIAAAFLAAKIMAIGFFIAVNIANPFFWIVVAIAAFTALQIKFDVVGKAFGFLRGIWDGVVNFLVDRVMDVIKFFDRLGKVLGEVGKFFVNVGKSIVSFFGAAITEVINFGTSVVNVFTTIFTVITTVMTSIWTVVQPVLTFIMNLFIIVFGSILVVVFTILTAVKDFIVTAFGVIWTVVSTVVSAVYNVIATIFNAIWGVIQPIVKAIWDFIVGAWNATFTTVTTILNALFAFVSGIWNAIFGAITSVANSIINFFAGAFNWLFERGKDIVNGLGAGIMAVAGVIWNAVKSVADQIGNFFKGAGEWLYNTGRSIIEGLGRGISDMAGWVADRAKDVGDGVVNGLKGLLGIHSPSTVMEKLGQYTMEGFQNGLDKGNASIMDSLSNSFTGQYNPTVTPMVSDMSVGEKPAPIVNHIGEINIASEVDGENWLKRLTRDEEVTSAGLVNYAL